MADEVKQVLVLNCVECGGEVDVPMKSLGSQDLAHVLNEKRWILTVISRPVEQPIRTALLCPECAPKVYPKEMLEFAREQMRKRASAS